jgi:hypothetical protein
MILSLWGRVVITYLITLSDQGLNQFESLLSNELLIFLLIFPYLGIIPSRSMHLKLDLREFSERVFCCDQLFRDHGYFHLQELRSPKLKFLDDIILDLFSALTSEWHFKVFFPSHLEFFAV